MSVLCSPSGAQNSAHMLSIFALCPWSGLPQLGPLQSQRARGGSLSFHTGESRPTPNYTAEIHKLTYAHKAEWQLRPPCFSCLRPPPGAGWQQAEESESSPDPHPTPPPAGGHGLVGKMYAWERDLRGKRAGVQLSNWRPEICLQQIFSDFPQHLTLIRWAGAFAACLWAGISPTVLSLASLPKTPGVSHAVVARHACPPAPRHTSAELETASM